MKDLPLPNATASRWDANPALLALIEALIEAHGANMWVFTGDPRHFWQFATRADVAALMALTPEQHEVLLGEWTDDDWDPGTFGYRWP